MIRTESGAVTRRPSGTAPRRWLLPVGAAVCAIALAAYLAAIASHAHDVMLKGFDLGVYLDGGRLARHTPAALYDWRQPGHPGIAFTYTPFAAMLFAVLSFAPLRTVADCAAAAGLLALAGTVWIAFGALGVRDTRQRWGATLLLAGVCLWLEPVQRTLYLGQVELLLMVLVTWDMCQPSRRPWQGAGVGLAAGIKLIPLIFIAYLLVTRRFRAALVAVAVFAATVAAGFAALPHASVQWWLKLNFLQAKRTGFVGVGNNQSLRGALTRFLGSVAHGEPAWIAAAVVAGVAGLAAAMLLHRAGRRFEGLMTCALTALLISPVSWDHHWVWIAPVLAVLIVAGTRARIRALWFAGAALVVAVFGAWPRFWAPGAGLLQGGLIWYAPATPWASGDNPRYLEYHWHGLQLLAGNLYVLAGVLLFAGVLAWAVSAARTSSPGLSPSRTAATPA